MSELSTEDCKKKLLELYPRTKSKFWKRVRKYKNKDEQWEREFNYTEPGQEMTTLLCEKEGELVEVQNTISSKSAALKTNPEINPGISITGSVNTLELGRLLGGTAGNGTVDKLPVPFTTSDSNETLFLLTLSNSIDWSKPEGQRSTFDFAKSIDFKHFVQACQNQNINLLESYVDYIGLMMDFYSDMDEDDVLSIIDTPDCNDSLADLKNVLLKILEGYETSNLTMFISDESNANLKKSFDQFNEIHDFFETELTEDIMMMTKSIVEKKNLNFKLPKASKKSLSNHL